MDFFTIFLAWLIEQWDKSGVTGMWLSYQLFMANAAGPDLTQPWFLTYWNAVFGMSLLIAVASVMLHATIMMFRDKHDTIVLAIGGFFRTVLSGMLLLVGIILAGYFLALVMSMINTLMTDVLKVSATSAEAPFVFNPSAIDLWLRLATSYIGMNIGQSLYIQAEIADKFIFFFAVWYLFLSALGTGKFSQLIRSGLFAALVTFLFARVFQAFAIGFSIAGIAAMNAANAPPIVVMMATWGAGLFAMLIPWVMWGGLTFASWKVERRLDLRLFLERQANNKTRAFSEDQIIQNRVSRLQAAKNGVQDGARNVVRTASIAATAAMFAKAGAMISGKIPGVQSKVAALGLTALHRSLQHIGSKATNGIDRRLSRPSGPSSRYN